jgi:NADH dehydrogenase [ubiquinone] 1 alpha subcomplex assembly factor 5
MIESEDDRSAFILADQERQGGISPHISPFLNIPDAGNLMSAAGFTLCTSNTVQYPLCDHPT